MTFLCPGKPQNSFSWLTEVSAAKCSPPDGKELPRQRCASLLGAPKSNDSLVQRDEDLSPHLDPDNSAKQCQLQSSPQVNGGLRWEHAVAQIMPCLILLLPLLSQVVILRAPLINSGNDCRSASQGARQPTLSNLCCTRALLTPIFNTLTACWSPHRLLR